jgi:prophage antirepressor-like protein
MIRTVWNETEQQWYFVVADVVLALTKTADAKSYTKKLRKYDSELRKVWGQCTTILHVQTTSGVQPITCANLLGLIRIMQSIRSPRAKHFVKWIAGLNIDPFDKNQGIELSEKDMLEFRENLNRPRVWMRKRNQFASENELHEVNQRMNELEMIFSLLEKDDIKYKPYSQNR